MQYSNKNLIRMNDNGGDWSLDLNLADTLMATKTDVNFIGVKGVDHTVCILQ